MARAQKGEQGFRKRLRKWDQKKSEVRGEEDEFAR